MLNRWVLSRDRKTATEGAEVTRSGRLFQTRAAATGKAWSPTARTICSLSCFWVCGVEIMNYTWMVTSVISFLLARELYSDFYCQSTCLSVCLSVCLQVFQYASSPAAAVVIRWYFVTVSKWSSWMTSWSLHTATPALQHVAYSRLAHIGGIELAG